MGLIILTRNRFLQACTCTSAFFVFFFSLVFVVMLILRTKNYKEHNIQDC